MSVIQGRVFREGLRHKVKVSRDLEEARELSNVGMVQAEDLKSQRP